MNNQMITSKIGTTTRGKIIHLPHISTKLEIMIFLRRFSIQDLIDILCMCEYLNARFKKKQFADFLTEVVKDFSLVLHELSQRGELEKTLLNLKLQYSLTRVQRGKNLVCSEFRD